MKRLQRILVPVDFSDCSKFALEYALALGRALDGHVEATFAWTVPEYVSPILAISVVGRDGKTTLQELGHHDAMRRMHHFLNGVDTTLAGGFGARVEYGDTVEEILRRATDADAVVMGTHGRKGIDRLMVGSVTERVVRASTHPVFVLHRAAEVPKRILVAVDFSDASRRALIIAHRLGERLGAEVSGVHVVEHVPAAEGLELLVHAFGGEAPEELEQYARGKAQQEIELFLSRTEGHEAFPITVRYGTPHKELVKHAEENAFDLVLIGTCGRARASHVKLGGTAINVLRHTTMPLLLVPPPSTKQTGVVRW